MASEAPAYPVRLETDYPERLSRLSTLFRLILAIPVLVLLALLYLPLPWLVFIHWVTVLVRGRPVGWLFDTLAAALRLYLRVSAYLYLLTDRYPPLEGAWPVRFEIERPERLSRRQLVFWKTALSIPHVLVLQVLNYVLGVLLFISWFAILFSGRYPRGLYNFVAGWLRWQARVAAYWLSLTDVFPPFSLSAEAGPGGRTGYTISAVAGWLLLLGSGVGIGFVGVGPGETTEVAVSYESLLEGEPSVAVVVSEVRVVLVEASDPYEFGDALYEPRLGERFVAFRLAFSNQSDSGVWIEWGDFHIEDSEGDGHGPFLVSVGGQHPPRRLQEGREGDAWLVFQLDEISAPAELRYSPSFGFKQTVKFRFQ